MRNSICLSVFLTISLGACLNNKIRSTELGHFDDWAASVASNQIDKAVDAYVGSITIVPTQYEYVILKASTPSPGIHQTYALVPTSGSINQIAPIVLNAAQVVRDKEGNVLIQDLEQPKAWKFTVRNAEPVVEINPNVQVTEIAVSTSATTTTLPQDKDAIQSLTTVFANKARELGLAEISELKSRLGEGGDSPFQRVKCDCRDAEPGPDDCQAGGKGASGCSLGDNGRNCSVTCATAIACCK